MLSVESLSFKYDQKKVLKNVSFQLPKGGHLAIMGESGSGKSTLLKVIYGLLEPKEGKVFWNGKQVMGPRYQLIAGEQSMKLVSQEPDLMPYISVRENIETHLSVFDEETHQERIDELLEIVGLRKFADVRADRLSGGQKQRVALAKAIAQEPEVLLLDEPFSNIDQFLKNNLRLQFFSNLQEKGITLITASHDPEDVIPFADYLLVIKNGKPIVFDSPKMVYDKPKSLYTASLFGYINELPISIFENYSTSKGKILIYPHEFYLTNDSGIEAYVVNNHFKGAHYLIEAVSKDGHSLYFTNANALKIHTQVTLNIPLSIINRRVIRE